ncbi:MAG: hypothetical protein FJ104_13710, partial [Deltaproteobacteria bacterium]|nr:hypothetical protein [Deltaproteobacteria bacterium]
PACDLAAGSKPREKITADITANRTLTSDKVWELEGIVHVADGVTLTVEPCTRIEGAKDPIGVLVVSRGGKIIANGTADAPILMTSKVAVGSRAAGDWGGLVLLGKAATNDGEALVEGLVDDPANKYGGSDNADSSGSLEYLRIEYAGFQLATDVEVNGLTMGSVGSGTKISHVMVSNSLDDCFEWFGGTVSADHLICNSDGDDMFDADRGFTGTITNAFGRKLENPSNDPNGFEWDNNRNDNAATPVSKPNFKNVTLCGFGVDVSVASYGMVIRRGAQATIDELVAVGFDYGIDARDGVGTTGASTLAVTNSTLFDMVKGVTNAAETDNDNGFDEAAWFAAGAGNTTTDPGFNTADCLAGDGEGPNAKVTGSGRGAFKDGDWLTGAWVDWSSK